MTPTARALIFNEAQPAGFDEAFVKGGLADAEALQHLTFSQDSLAGHNRPTPLAPRRSRLLAELLQPMRRACQRHKNKGVALMDRKNPLFYLRERFLLRRVMRCFRASAVMPCLAAISAIAES